MHRDWVKGAGQQKGNSGACACLLSLWERLGEGAKLESQNRRPAPDAQVSTGIVFAGVI